MTQTVPLNSIRMEFRTSTTLVSDTVNLNFVMTHAVNDPSVDSKQAVLEAANSFIDGEWKVSQTARRHEAGILIVAYALEITVNESQINFIIETIKQFDRPGFKIYLSSANCELPEKDLYGHHRVLRNELYSQIKYELGVLNDGKKENDEEWMIGNVEFSTPEEISIARDIASGMHVIASYSSTQTLTMVADTTFVRKIYSRL